jgi:hypothetical protein
MSITTQAGLIAAMASMQKFKYLKTSHTSVAEVWFSMFDQAGNPGAGTLAGANTANGVVPDDTVTGFPPINPFGGGNLGYIASIDFGSSLPCRWKLFDCLFKAGAYSFNSAVSLSSQPSYSARIPGGNYAGTQIWLETVTPFTGNQSIAVTYTGDQGGAGHSTGTIATGVAPIADRMLQLQLQAGDSGVQKIESVTSTVATVGTFNVLVLRPLISGRVKFASDGGFYGPDLTSLPQIYATSALYMLINSDSATTGQPEFDIGIING